jgi:hypothetical protein
VKGGEVKGSEEERRCECERVRINEGEEKYIHGFDNVVVIVDLASVGVGILDEVPNVDDVVGV